MTQFTGRWHPPMTTDIDKLEDRGNSQAAFGELDGDHPPKPDRKPDEIGTFTPVEVEDYYDQGRPEDIRIINPEEES